jgi:hypothetical protein
VKRALSGVLGIYEHVDAAVDTILALRRAGRKDITAITPVPYHEIQTVMDPRPSPVRFVTFFGGLLGGSLGFLLCAWTSRDWPMITAGKEILSAPPFMVITFECTVLLAGISNLLAMFFFSRLPHVFVEERYDPRFSEDRIGIWVPCRREDAEAIAGQMRKAGAEEVRVDAA